MKVFIPVYTTTATEGGSGQTLAGPGFCSYERAKEWLDKNPNPREGEYWGESSDIVAVEVEES